MENTSNRFVLLISGLLFIMFYVSQCSAQSKDWGILVNNKEWYYEGGRIFRGTKEQCERKCEKLNFHPSESHVTVPGGDYWPTQGMMDDFVRGVDEERRKVEKNVYVPAKILSDINDNVMQGNFAAMAGGQIASQNAEFNNENVMTTIGGDPRFNKENKGFEGAPPPKKEQRSRNEVLQEDISSDCSKLVGAEEYEQLADEYLLSPYLFREKYTSLCKQYGCDGIDDDYKVFAKELKSVIEKRLEEMDEELDR